MEAPEDELIGSLIARLRKARGKSQQDLVEMLSAVSGDPALTRETVSRWERGARIPGRYWRNWLTKALEIPIDTLDRAASTAATQRSARLRMEAGEGPEFANIEKDRFRFAAITRANWPGTCLSKPVPGYGIDWHLILSGGRFFDGSMAAIYLRPGTVAASGATVVEVGEARQLDPHLRQPERALLVAAEEAAETMRFFVLDAREACRQLDRRPSTRPTMTIPRAYELDDFTFGILWAAASLDDALLVDDFALAESRRKLRAYGSLAGSAVSREAASNLTTVSQRWLGSDFCARHILRNLWNLTDVPLFWTCEERGEEACTWLLFRHKHAYLKETSRRFVGAPYPLVRAFCIPETAVRGSPAFERILLFLAAALMESLGIRVEVCTEPEYSEVEGFVLAAGKHAIIANWVRSEGIWHVDTTVRRSLLRDFADAAGHACAHSAIGAATPSGRLVALASYLDLDWRWLRRRCLELSEYGCAGFARPRSRLLSVAGLDAACRYVGGLDTEDGGW